LKVPSVDCILMRNRFKYLRRILASQPKSLLAILSAILRGQRLAWATPLLRDLEVLRIRVSIVSRLPAPSDDPAAWVEFIKTNTVRWNNAVMCLFFAEAVNDKHSELTIGERAPVQSVRCTVCSESFASTRAMRSHYRSKHKLLSDARVLQRYFA
jgi:hypothetical protein